jgi:hypothetical protein
MCSLFVLRLAVCRCFHCVLRSDDVFSVFEVRGLTVFSLCVLRFEV